MIGRRLHDIRRLKSMNQIDFAAKIGVSQTALVAYEKDDRDPPTSALVALSNKFDVRAEWILNGTGLPFRGEETELFKQVYWLEKENPLQGHATDDERIQYRILLHRYLIENGTISKPMLESLSGRKTVNE
jgi:transcriptional regulator with XRE-family HTH domain